ncbi:MAG: enoyl-CoA hydratase [Hydrogenophilales bacterium 16-64-46]|nr:MAG: enoyl-CoA hydratase [Hydrogenophilales bacterium 12-64-13]OYZ06868.1 MAG: enoyl-CoA hydratase [Hydrogenophilales bacterium 16-64-46]OZA37012.1 MAG: enoyl-CoA hydratase [Hydrogenophilales bacterium 17-64-34]HQS99896.1 crotonase/enoyl-CoA hydratase family protein [Thiobacillus sp.]
MTHLHAVRTTLQPQGNAFTQLTTYFDPHSQIAWGYMHAEPRPCFTPVLLRELQAWGNGLVAQIDDPDAIDVKYFVIASKVPETFSLGGDLNLFMQHIHARDREALHHYAVSCVECSFAVHSHLNRPNVTSIALVQGQALGGGFESALAANVLVAERGSKMGLPEILFNLFPGMGAMTFLGRKVGHHLAEKIIRSGKLYLAEELYEMGVVDVLAEPGEGEAAVHEHVRREEKSRNGLLALRAAREISQPASCEELIRITEIWVDAALRLDARDLRMMERLVSRQTVRAGGASGEDSHALSA